MAGTTCGQAPGGTRCPIPSMGSQAAPGIARAVASPHAMGTLTAGDGGISTRMKIPTASPIVTPCVAFDASPVAS